MLAAGPARAVDIDLQVLRPDFDVGGLLDLRDDLDQRERRMAPVRLVEWRQPNQPVNAALRAEPAEGALTRDSDGDALIAGLFTRRLVENLAVHLVAFRPAQVHPQQYLGPILRVRPPRAGMDADQRRVFGVPIGEEKVNLLLAQVGIESSEVLLEGALQMAVVLGHRQFRQTDDVTGPSFEFSPDLDLLPQSLRFLGEPLRSRGLLPDVGVG